MTCDYPMLEISKRRWQKLMAYMVFAIITTGLVTASNYYKDPLTKFLPVANQTFPLCCVGLTKRGRGCGLGMIRPRL
jgi:hypothetical protein